MPSAIEHLTLLQQKVSRPNLPDWSIHEIRRLLFFEIDGLLHVAYYGLPWPDPAEEEEEEAVLPLFETLCQPEVAHQIASLILSGPDEGANGTRDWDFSPLLAQEVTFPELRSLIIKPSPLENHNFAIVGSGYEESGQLAAWISKAPQLKHLAAPSAPNAEFFQVGHVSLNSLRIDAGYDAQEFILNLSRSSSPEIYTLDWGEVHNFHHDLWEAGCTPYEHYDALFRSPACPRDVTLRNPNLTDEQLAALAAIKRRTHLRVIRTSVGKRL
jgi:hypothetical protein